MLDSVAAELANGASKADYHEPEPGTEYRKLLSMKYRSSDTDAALPRARRSPSQATADSSTRNSAVSSGTYVLLSGSSPQSSRHGGPWLPHPAQPRNWQPPGPVLAVSRAGNGRHTVRETDPGEPARSPFSIRGNEQIGRNFSTPQRSLVRARPSNHESPSRKHAVTYYAIER